jgi:hypothetical protein
LLTSFVLQIKIQILHSEWALCSIAIVFSLPSSSWKKSDYNGNKFCCLMLIYDCSTQATCNLHIYRKGTTFDSLTCAWWIQMAWYSVWGTVILQYELHCKLNRARRIILCHNGFIQTLKNRFKCSQREVGCENMKLIELAQVCYFCNGRYFHEQPNN